jgi:hypothetical protein
MRPVVFPAIFFLAFFGRAPAEEPSGSNGSPLKLPPELITLNDQFLKAQAGQVTAPYRADVERLDAAYLSSLDRALASKPDWKQWRRPLPRADGRRMWRQFGKLKFKGMGINSN